LFGIVINGYLFAEGGIIEVPSNHKVTDFKMIVLILVDADSFESGVSPNHILRATSPRREQFSRLHKTATLNCYHEPLEDTRRDPSSISFFFLHSRRLSSPVSV
jgi:hypothetical protein